MTEPNPRAEIEKIEENIRQLEKLKADGLMPPELADASIEALKTKHATYQAQVQGGGASAQGADSTAVGQQGVGVKGSVSSSLINTGTIFQVYQSASGKPRLDEAGFERILRNYLEWLRKAYGKARLYGLESIQTSGSQKKRELSEVFVPLSLQRFSPPSRAEVEEHVENFKGDLYAEQRAFLSLVERKREGGEAIPTESLLTHGNRLAVIGGAGSGKSTLLAYLAAMFAEYELTSTQLPFQLPEGRKTLVPLVIPLRYRREYLRLCKEAPSTVLMGVRPGTIAGFVLWYLKKRSQAIRVTDESLAEEFFDRLLLGGGCLVMLDGLDEVVSQSDRGQVRAEVERLADEIYPDNLFIVTARESGYKENAIFSEDFIRLDVQSLKDEQIEALVHNWCEQLYPDKVEDQMKDILRSISSINRRYEEQNLPALVRTPLMTTMVVSVKWGETELPRERARLYEAVVKVILQAQYLDDDDQTKELVNWGGAWEEQREWLSYLALEMHRGGQNGAAIPETRLREILAPKLSQENLDQFVRAVRSRGGLFEERAELFQFAHLTFQEFLAARLLAKDREKSFPILEEHIPDAWWREVLLLVYGFSKQDYAPFSSEYLQWLSNRDTTPALHLSGLELAGSAILELEKPESELRLQQSELLINALENVENTSFIQLRFLAGNTLSSLGDLRFDPDNWMLPKDNLFGFVKISAGEFIMGSNFISDEEPEHYLTLPDYWIMKYPVTQSQFNVFINDTGYIPDDKKCRYGNSNHPVTYVTWSDALEYCYWLNKKMVALGQMHLTSSKNASEFWEKIVDRKIVIDLPNEPEWEKAARGSTGNLYPWGNDINLIAANIKEAEIGTTISVGIIPQGKSVYGVFDLVGNIKEWTKSLWGIDRFDPQYKYPYNNHDGRENIKVSPTFYRVLRGADYKTSIDYSRSSYRFRQGEVNWAEEFGFRVVAHSPKDN